MQRKTLSMVLFVTLTMGGLIGLVSVGYAQGQESRFDGDIDMTGRNRRIYMGGYDDSTFGIAYNQKYSDYGIFYTASTPDFVSISPNGGASNGVMNIYENGNVGIGTVDPKSRLTISGENNGETNSASIELNNTTPNIGRRFGISSSKEGLFQIFDLTASGATRLVVDAVGNVGIGTLFPEAKLHVIGTTRTNILQIDGGSDLAEPFGIAGAEAIEPGMVVAIDPDNIGRLRLADKAYDRTVAGVISGAGGINPGLIMQQDSIVFDDTYPVALTGRVYVWVDASYNPIQPGDLLTTSNTPGHAMKVTNYKQAQGAILGKAMSSLEKGAGLVLILVTLQ